MRFLRKRFVSKFLAVLLTLLIIESTVHSTITYALTTGPHQPEYTSYEEPGAKDMVNLLTGDFSFSLPILDVPGPEGGFSVPLTYNAGIGLEQEASWVGLGWTLNVGAITRQVNQYPDDASGEVQSVTMKDLVGSRGWSTNIGIGQFGWNNNIGHYGNISILGIINASWDDSGFTYGVLGINTRFGYNGSVGVSIDAAQMAMGLIQIGLTIATAGTSTIAQIATQVAISTAVQVGVGLALGSQTPNAPTGGAWQYSKRTENHLFFKNYWVWLDQTRNENMLGLLNLDFNEAKASSTLTAYVGGSLKPLNSFVKPSEANGFASDINYYAPWDYIYETSPIKLATDNYSVKAPGISGAIIPYRLDVQTVSMPRDMTDNHKRYGISSTAPYRVPFIYEGMFSNNYYTQLGTGSTTTPLSLPTQVSVHSDAKYNINTPQPGAVRADVKANSYKIPRAHHVEWFTNQEIINRSFSDGKPIEGMLMDYFSRNETKVFREDELKMDAPRKFYSSTSTIQDGRIPLLTYEINKIDFNSEIKVKLTTSFPGPRGGTRYIFKELSKKATKNSTYISIDPTGFESYNNARSGIEITTNYLKRPDQIGAYAITGVDGKTYHFSLPSYDYGNYTKIEDVTDTQNKYSEIKRNEAFASAWLLTGVTGPDYVDRNDNGMIDKADWGYWVKFTYGKLTDDYRWAMPYFEVDRQKDSPGNYQSRSVGQRQQYYLNTIQTRSHVAVFIKDDRHDGRGIHPADKPSTAANADKTLLLKKIVLLPRTAYETIFPSSTTNGRTAPTSDETVTNANLLYTTSTFSSSSSQNTLEQSALKQIVFNHTYELCKNIPNTTHAGEGKLTLKSLTILGRNNVQTLPNYKFDYGLNPDYDKTKWDGWGAYSSQGTDAVTSHAASPVDADGAAWSLNKITTPMGSTIEVNYERDDYSSISGNQIEGTYASVSKTWPTFYLYYGNNEFDLTGANNIFNVGEKVVIKNGYVSYKCIPPAGSPPNVNDPYFQFDPLETSVSDVTSNKLTLATRVGGGSSQCPTNNSIKDVTYRCDVYKIMSHKKGGNIRVASIVTKDGEKQLKTMYLYNKGNGFSAGVIGYEPDFISSSTQSFQNLPGYPFTPVMYSTVSVLTGKLTTDADYVSKQVYEFETPNTSLLYDEGPAPYINGSRLVINKIKDYTSRIGKLISTSTYGPPPSTQPVSITQFNYETELANNQGIFAESSLMIEDVSNTKRLTHTTILKYPYELKKVVTTKDGLTTETENLAWDFITGIVLEKTQTSPLGVKTKSVTKLAYTVPAYAAMGSKAINPNNKNMLGHDAANYTYLLDASGNSIGLLGASVQTYKSDWNNYRYLNGNEYAEGVDGSPNIWRKHQNYVYKGSFSDLRSDGSLTFSPSKEFNFTSGATNSGWQQVGEATRFDHYSAALEGRDLNRIYSSSKKDIEGKLMLASASNAAYTEFAYSGAEDWAASGTGAYLGGEVAKGDGEQVNKNRGNEVHTGNVSLQLSSGKGFVFKTGVLRNLKTYRASVWTNSVNGRLYYDNGTETVSPAPLTTKKVGDWYLLEMEIKTSDQPNQVLEVGVKTVNGSEVLFDDFRFQPAEAAVIANVYDPVTEQLTHTLDNQNMFTRYEYNDKGQLVRTYQETFTYGVKLISEKKVNYRRDFIDK
jgi:hypothetical protein